MFFLSFFIKVKPFDLFYGSQTLVEPLCCCFAIVRWTVVTYDAPTWKLTFSSNALWCSNKLFKAFKTSTSLDTPLWAAACRLTTVIRNERSCRDTKHSKCSNNSCGIELKFWYLVEWKKRKRSIDILRFVDGQPLGLGQDDEPPVAMSFTKSKPHCELSSCSVSPTHSTIPPPNQQTNSLTLVLLRSAFNSAISSSRSSNVSLACVSSFVSVANSCNEKRKQIQWFN